MSRQSPPVIRVHRLYEVRKRLSAIIASLAWSLRPT